MELLHGRPADPTGRADKEIRVYDLLDRLSIAYDRTDHEAAMTMDDCLEIDRILDTLICKNLFLCNRQKTKYYLLLMPGDKPFHTKDLSAQIGSARLSFASAEDMEKYLGVTPGSATVMGLMNDPDNRVQLLIDRQVIESERFACHPCVNTSSLRMATRDMLGVFLPAVRHEPILVDLPEDP